MAVDDNNDLLLEEDYSVIQRLIAEELAEVHKMSFGWSCEPDTYVNHAYCILQALFDHGYDVVEEEEITVAGN